jgi:hypothetical protein
MNQAKKQQENARKAPALFVPGLHVFCELRVYSAAGVLSSNWRG